MARKKKQSHFVIYARHQDEELQQLVKSQAAYYGLTVSEYVTRALDHFVGAVPLKKQTDVMRRRAAE